MGVYRIVWTSGNQSWASKPSKIVFSKKKRVKRAEQNSPLEKTVFNPLNNRWLGGIVGLVGKLYKSRYLTIIYKILTYFISRKFWQLFWKTGHPCANSTQLSYASQLELSLAKSQWKQWPARKPPGLKMWQSCKDIKLKRPFCEKWGPKHSAYFPLYNFRISPFSNSFCT